MASLRALVKQKGKAAAWEDLVWDTDNSIKLDKIVLSSMMKTLGYKESPDHVYHCIEIVEKFVERDPKQADEYLFNALLEVCFRMKDTQRVKATLWRMQEFKVPSSQVTLGILVKGYGQVGDLAQVLKTWDDMAEQRESASPQTFGCMIDACVKNGDLKKALEIFEYLKRKKEHQNVIIYCMLIKGCGTARDVGTALRLFREMREEQVPYNQIVYNSMLDVCIKNNNFEDANMIFEEMKANQYGIKPDIVSFSTMMKGYCTHGDLKTAVRITQDIRAAGLRCDELMYNTLLDGCVRKQDIALADWVQQDMDYNGIKSSNITKSILRKLHPGQKLRTGESEDMSQKRRRTDASAEPTWQAQESHGQAFHSSDAGDTPRHSPSQAEGVCAACGSTVAVELGFDSCAVCKCPEVNRQ